MTAPEKTVRWGILGAGRIAHRFAASLAHVPDARLVALSCRSAAKAAAFGAAFGVDGADALADEALGNEPGAAHEALLARDDIDAIYLALPHGLHYPWAMRALAAGKAVLCEKPAMLNAREMRAVAQAARAGGVLFMEALKTRFTPCYQRVRALVDAGAIGEVVRVECALENDMGGRIAAGNDYMSDPRQGGVLLDTGIYCAGWLEDYVEGAPRVTSCRVRYEGAVDSFVDAELAYPRATGRLVAAGDTAELPRQARLVGTEGEIVVDDLHRPEHALLMRQGAAPEEIRLPYEVDDFFGQIDHFCDLTRAGATESPIVPLSASIRTAELLDAVRAAFPPRGSAHRA